MRPRNCLRLLLAACLVACQQETKFDKAKWASQTDLAAYPFRNLMLQDLVDNRPLKGLTRQQTTEILGLPDDKNANVFSYNLVTKYGNDIDPVYTKYLSLTFGKDSTIIAYEIAEWKK